MPQEDLVRVDQLEAGVTIVGTGPSGPFEDGPRRLVLINEIPPTNRAFKSEYRLFFDNGSVVFFGSTLVIVDRTQVPA